MDTVSIAELARNITPTSSILVTRFSGKRFWEELASCLSSYDRNVTVFLSFDGIDVMDASFADEVFGRLAIMRARKCYPFCFIVLKDLNETSRENLEMALSTRIDREPSDKPHIRNCVLAIMEESTLGLLGKHENHVHESFVLLNEKHELTARDVSGLLDISLNAASTRLKVIADLGLARRLEIRDNQGKQFTYHKII